MSMRPVSLIVLLTLLVGTLAAVSVQSVPTVSLANDPTVPRTTPAQIEPTATIALAPIGTYRTGVFGESAAEIVTYDPEVANLYVTNGFSNTIDILNISDPTNPTLQSTIDLPGDVNSADFEPDAGLLAVAVAADPEQDPGQVILYDRDGNEVETFIVGALPDMVTFTPDGEYILVANEGEPGDASDPNGSVSIIDVAAETISTAEFTAFNGREAELRARGVRIFPGKSFAEDAEPEYIAVSPDSSTAFVTLQENNAFAVIDIANATVADILPLGLKDHSQGPATLATYDFPELPVLGKTPGDQEILLGGLSGLWLEGVEPTTGNYQFVTVPDRGPNGAPTDVDNDGENERPFVLPEYQARIVRFELNPTSGTISITDQLPLTRDGGTMPITGLPNISGVDEEPVDLNGNLLNYDPFGADMEGVVIDPSGNYWMVDEYRPAIYQFNASGELLNRYVPSGTAALAGEPEGTFGTETLPAEYANRRRNRGFEGMALDTDSGILYAFIQTPLSNPDRSTGDTSSVIRMLGINPATGEPVAEYVYLLEKPAYRSGGVVDKIGDAVYAGNGIFYVIERDSATNLTGKKFIFKVNLTGATNLLAPGAPSLPAGETLEAQSPDHLAALNIQPVNKIKVANLPSLGYLAGDKPEGLALLPDGRLAVLNDNDFGLLDEPIPGDGTVPFNPNPVPVVLGIISFPEGNQFDASDRDDTINLANWPVYGMYMPDAITSFAVGAETYYVTANEGDARDEDARLGELTLDPTAFPNASDLQQETQLGRLEVSDINGDLDGDDDYDQLWAYGARSFTIWDAYGNLVYDSGDEFAEITAAVYPADFNADNDENNSFDSRSDAKGSEPEALTTGTIGGRTYAFIGLERIGGIMVYDVTDPSVPSFVQYVNNRDFNGDAEADTAGDLGPEGVIFIPATDSPTGAPLLVVTNEVSGSTTVYSITNPDGATTLTLLHNNDGESSLLPIENTVEPGTGYLNTETVTLETGSVAAFATLIEQNIDVARTAGNSVVNVYAGDAFLASGTLICSLDDPAVPVYDAVAQRQIPYDAHILGNHEFDYGPNFLERFIREFEINGVLTQPFLSANLDFSGVASFADLIDEDGLIEGYSTNGRVVARSAIVIDELTGKRFGIVGATTPALPTISSPGDVQVTTADLNETAAVVQTEIDRLTGKGVNKIIFVSHLQSVSNDEELIQKLSDVDIAVAGGGDELLTNPTIPETTQLLPGEQAEVEGTYPLEATDADGQTVYIVTTAGNYKYLGRLDITFDEQGEVSSIISEESYPRRVIPTSTTATALGLTDAVTPDAEIVASVNEPVVACLSELENTPVVRSEVPLDVSRSGVRGGESNAGNLIADAFLYAYEQYAGEVGLPPESDSNQIIALQNGGGIRQNAGDLLPTGGTPGTISLLDTLNVLPFPNFVTVVSDVAPADLKAILERSAATLPADGGQFLQVGGFDVTYVVQNEVGNRVYAVTLDDGTPIVQNGTVVAGAPSVRIVTNSFTAGGGDDYETLANNSNKLQLPLSYEQAWREYLESFPVEEGLPTIQSDDPRYQPGGAGRITILSEAPAPGGTTLYMPIIAR